VNALVPILAAAAAAGYAAIAVVVVPRLAPARHPAAVRAAAAALLVVAAIAHVALALYAPRASGSTAHVALVHVLPLALEVAGAAGVLWAVLAGRLAPVVGAARGADSERARLAALVEQAGDAIVVTDQKRYEGQLQYLADHDPLTGLYNRRRLEDELERARQFVSRYGEPAALLVLDVDNFKYVNDTFGHAVGDEVLARIAGLIRSRCRETDVVARFGGDEFAIVCPHTDAPAADAVAAHLLETLRSTPLVTVGDRSIHVTASVGVTTLEAGEHPNTQDAVVKADVAMYDAKEAGRDRACRAVDDAKPARVRARLTWSQRIRGALEDDGFELWEQPILTMANFSCGRSELLLRMRGDDDEAIAPAVFLPVAEQFGQLPAIDRWVVERAVRLLAERQAAGHDHHLAVNLSSASITDEAVVDSIAEIVRGAPIDPTRLTFEIAETAAISTSSARGTSPRRSRASAAG
jgi:diguanylate cyclase (GGDEF)-like protein